MDVLLLPQELEYILGLNVDLVELCRVNSRFSHLCNNAYFWERKNYP